MAAEEAFKATVGYVHDAPFEISTLQVDGIHSLYYEQYGPKNGLPVVFLHGGPGGETCFDNTKFFNPAVYRVVLFDQRGSGKSTPKGELRENTSHHLVADIEKLREHLGVQKWHMVFGGSWGTTLGLLYTQTHPERVKYLVLRGVTTMRQSEMAHGPKEVNWASRFYPEMYDQLIEFLPEEERSDPIEGYYKRLISGDQKFAAAKEWMRWALTIDSLRRDEHTYSFLDEPEECLNGALIESHYFKHKAWLKEGQLLLNAEKMSHIDGAIVQGRYDLITPPQTAWELHKAWPRSSLYWIDAAGHSSAEPGVLAKLVEVCDKFAKLE
ncbi:proline iminopeptidase [Xylariales sp. PMI_506]|nr:proline iminopeptidase [Xylariales sp. PMI_506]